MYPLYFPLMALARYARQQPPAPDLRHPHKAGNLRVLV
jgi:hypothetical protein